MRWFVQLYGVAVTRSLRQRWADTSECSDRVERKSPAREEHEGMFERFTDRARRVVVLAQEEARMLNHNYIGTEHILLGLIHEGEGVARRL